jgi:uncharacterized DUF497 family protein
MEKLPISWNELESLENYSKYKVTFSDAKEVVQNMSSLKIRNIGKDYNFIGPVNDLSKILIVTCSKEDGIRKILKARKASRSEESAYFMNLPMGGLE